MAESIILSVAIVVVFALAAMGRGAVSLLRSRGAQSARIEDEARVAAEIARDRALTDLRDLEMEHALRKLNDTDYQELKNHAEGDAYIALRKLREITEDSDRKPSSSAILVFALAGALGALGPQPAEAQQLPAGHPPIASSPAVPANPAVGRIDVHAVHIAPNGVTRPLGGARAVLTIEQRRPGPREVHDMVQESTLVLDSHGRTVVTDQKIPAGGRARLSLVHEGVRFEALADAEGRLRVQAHDAATTLEGVTARVHVGLSVDEARVWVQTDLVFNNPTGRVIDLSGSDAALQLPLVGPVIGALVLTAGWMPPQARRHMRLRTTPDRGQLDLVDGAWTYRGLVMPGATTRLQVRYPIDIHRDEMVLGVRFDEMAIEDLLVTMESGSRVEPEVILSRPSAGQGSDEIGGTTRVAWLDGPLPAGESLQMTLLRLPASPDVVRRMVLLSLFAAAAALGVGLLRARALSRAPHA